METRTFTGKITIENAITRANEYCREIKNNLGLTSLILDQDSIWKIEEEWVRIKAENEHVYLYYEIGRRFITEHFVASLTNNIKLSQDEQKTLREVMGRVYHAPPKIDVLTRAKAARDMDARYGEVRSKQIYDALGTEIEKIRKSITSQEHVMEVRDMFFNPLQIYPGLDCENFGELASWIEDMAELNAREGYDTTYV